MSKIITPTVGRKVWFRLNGINELEKPRSGTETTPVRSFPSAVDPTQPLDATVVWPNFKPTHWMPLPGKQNQTCVAVVDPAVAGG